jgi:hypothetical protein
MRRAVARKGFSPGESITICPTLQLSKHDTGCLQKTILRDRLFRAQGGQALFALGYAAMCLPVGLTAGKINARVVFDPSVNAIEIICADRIERGEKILCSPEAVTKHGGITTPIIDEKVEVRESAGKGRGLFARRPHHPRTIIGRYPVLVVPSSERELIFRTILDSYHYDWGHGNLAIPLGLWMLHNTTSDGTTRTTNASYWPDHEERTVVNYCIKPISEGDEITIPYRGIKEPLSKLGVYGIVQ